jgi:hypothetical protein
MRGGRAMKNVKNNRMAAMPNIYFRCELETVTYELLGIGM